jgi:superfamily II DNA or RNA helicase
LKPIILDDVRGILTPRCYQGTAVVSGIRELNRVRSTLIVSPTGTGKTVTFAEIALRWPADMGRVLVLAHRTELIEQACEKIELHTGERPTVEQADRRDRRGFQGWQSKVVVGSVQTLCQPKRLATLNPREFGLVVVDEGHHATAQTYLRILWHMLQGNPDLRILLVTATPEMADGKGLGAPLKWPDGERRPLIESVAFRYELRDAIRDGWLVDIQQQYVQVDGLDFSQVHDVGGDLNEGELETAMMGGVVDATTLEETRRQEGMLHKVLAPTIELAAGRPTLLFAVTVKHAQRMSELAPNYGVKCRCVHGGTPWEDRKAAIAAFKAGDCMLAGVGVFTEGFDAPTCAVVSMARPTKSKGLYTQVVGRGTRPLPGLVDGPETPEERRAAIAGSQKPHMTVLDFVGNSGRHALVSSADILAGESPDPLLLAAVKAEIAKTSGGRSMLDAIAEARQRAEDAKRRAEEERLSRSTQGPRMKANATYQTREVNAFGGETYVPATAPVKATGGRGTSTDKQVAYLVSLGVARSTAQGYSKRQASAVIDSMLKKTAVPQ